MAMENSIQRSCKETDGTSQSNLQSNTHSQLQQLQIIVVKKPRRLYAHVKLEQKRTGLTHQMQTMNTFCSSELIIALISTVTFLPFISEDNDVLTCQHYMLGWGIF